MKQFKTIFMGTPDFSVPSLEMLTQHPLINLTSVLTMPDRPAGRGQQLNSPPVANFCKSQKIPLIQTENVNKSEELKIAFQKQKPDLIIVLAFAQFLNDDILNAPAIGCFNIHTSLLPKYRGAAPIQYALLNGDESTGVSIQKMVKQMDAGDLVHSHSVDIAPFETGGMLYTRLKFQAALSLSNFINDLSSGDIKYTPQDKSNISFAPTLKKGDGHLNFRDKTSSQLFNTIRALKPWPGTHCFMGKKRLKVLDALHDDASLSPGEVSIKKNMIVVGCHSGSLRLSQVQLEGKKPCSDIELLNGVKELDISLS